MILSSRILIASAIAAVALVPAAQAQSGNGKLINYLNTLPMETVSAAEQVDLIMMRQEEKLARDVYQVMFFVWKQPVFDNISKAEQNHMDLVKLMLDKYSIPDPLTSDAWGVYKDPAFTQLFVQLVGIGVLSPLHALTVGGYIEDLDIADLNAAIKLTDNRDIKTVWQNLIQGSRNHLRSFYGQLASQNLIYPGFVLTYAEIQAIVTTPKETRPVDENGTVLP